LLCLFRAAVSCYYAICKHEQTPCEAAG